MSKSWTGRVSQNRLYLHEKVVLLDLDDQPLPETLENSFALLGYACDEGVSRNQGRIGAAKGPEAIRRQLGKLPNHLSEQVKLYDVGTVSCNKDKLDAAHEELGSRVGYLLEKGSFPVLLGGGHDMAYAHYQGLRSHLGTKASIGIINFDAHFDLRSNENGNNSGTPFYQIAQEARSSFNYMCLGIRKDANDRILFETADRLGVDYLSIEEFSMSHFELASKRLLQFIERVEHVYVTIDMDGFSSAYAPGVSAASPMGFSPDVVREALQIILKSGKLRCLDLAEMNPVFDQDDQTAKLAASLIHFITLELSLL